MKNEIGIEKMNEFEFQKENNFINIKKDSFNLKLDIDYYRKIWFNKSYLFDQLQTDKSKAKERFDNISSKLSFQFPEWFKPNFTFKTTKKIKKGVIKKPPPTPNSPERIPTIALNISISIGLTNT